MTHDDDDDLDAIAAWLALEAKCLRCEAQHPVNSQAAAARWLAEHAATCPGRQGGSGPS